VKSTLLAAGELHVRLCGAGSPLPDASRAGAGLLLHDTLEKNLIAAAGDNPER
jgi:hypothetical protein